MLLPLLANVFIGRESLQRLQTFGKVVGHQESRQMLPELLMGIVVVTIDRRLFERAVHPLDLTIRPGMIGLGQAMLNPVFGSNSKGKA